MKPLILILFLTGCLAFTVGLTELYLKKIVENDCAKLVKEIGNRTPSSIK